MNETVAVKFMRPKPYGKRVGVSVRTVYHHITEKIFPAYKFQGVILLDVDECDQIIKGMRRSEIKTPARCNLRKGKSAAKEVAA